MSHFDNFRAIGSEFFKRKKDNPTEQEFIAKKEIDTKVRDLLNSDMYKFLEEARAVRASVNDYALWWYLYSQVYKKPKYMELCEGDMSDSGIWIMKNDVHRSIPSAYGEDSVKMIVDLTKVYAVPPVYEGNKHLIPGDNILYIIREGRAFVIGDGKISLPMYRDVHGVVKFLYSHNKKNAPDWINNLYFDDDDVKGSHISSSD